jgi:hypothetical protein
VPFSSSAQKQTLIGGVPHQHVLETKAAFQAMSVRKDDTCRR